ncbi:MAG: transporter substrate-binding domain-containing protein [Duncaniella sp.]|uniref:transporter substrate-binding domain-containing protein n=1 Tax=Duncaniella sp. TaxID=2518496 RepID=UPI0023C19254|nr:transporter substrate-binding domain-containing protein [Duncaniella sp.]MDE6091384.1 transporter substrate-binding domain-containing protein [Duncaniella sp.]
MSTKSNKTPDSRQTPESSTDRNTFTRPDGGKDGKKKRGLQSMFHDPRAGILLSLMLIAVGLIVSVRECSTPMPSNGYEYVRGRGDTINVAIDYSPMSLYRFGDSLAGFNYEMMKDMAAMYGDNVKFYPIASVNEALDELKAGKYDVVISDLPVTASRRESFRFTEPVYLDKQVLISRDTTVKSRLDLGGKEIWSLEGSPAAERLHNLAREIGDTIIMRHDSIRSAEQLFMLTAMGKIPFAVINSAKAIHLAKDYPDVDVTTPVSFTQFQSWVVNKDNPALADTLDSQIRRFKQTPQYKDLIDRYLLQTAEKDDEL